ncbi:MAG: hypothetical protein K9K30_15035 [Burkholderiaceae bacterium]|nr:hypothetical protein [Sulfuritalea sp.]MCF8176551.1 hypothetical protein [Burkholderiaceae bacterium]
MRIYLVTVGIIFAIMLGGIAVERLYRGFAARNPKLGPFRDVGKCGSCSSGSGCSDAPDDVADAEPTTHH